MKKPLNGKAYGHIPHLPSSRMGPADHACHEGQFRICCEEPRDKHDRIIVTEKLDGSCVSVANVNGEILAIARSGHLASTSPFEHLRSFSTWVNKNKSRFNKLPVGTRLCGEWLAMAHGTIYNTWTNEPFVLFDAMNVDGRLPHDDARALFYQTELDGASIVHDGSPISVDAAMGLLGRFGRHGATEEIEGAVWRVERRGKFDFMAKWVNPQKQDGKYLEKVSGVPAIWLVERDQ